MIKKTFILLFLLICSIANTKPYNTNESYVNWKAGKIEAYGTAKMVIQDGHPVDPENRNTISINKSRMIAYSNAKEAAKIQLISVIKKIRIDSDKTMNDLLQQNNITRTRLAQIIDNNMKVMQKPINFFKVTCKVTITISDILPAIPYTYPVDHFPAPLHNPIQTKYSSLIIDTRGLNIPAMILPVVYNETGLEIYSKNFIDPKSAARHGLVSYVYTDNEARSHIKSGDKPYYTIALKNSKGCPVISDKDTRRLLSSKHTLSALKQCRVIFIIDRKQ